MDTSSENSSPFGINISGIEEKDLRRLQELEDELDQVWSKSSGYAIDDEAWKTMPLFMENITDKDVEENAAVCGLTNLMYEDTNPEDVAERLKNSGNQNLSVGIKTGNLELFRSAVSFYTEALSVEGASRSLRCALYSNRSQAHLYLQNNYSALLDAERAIYMNPEHIKSYHRAVQACVRLRRYEKALKFAENVFEREKNWAEFSKIEAKIQDLLNSQKGKKVAISRTYTERLELENSLIRYLQEELKIRTADTDMENLPWHSEGLTVLSELTKGCRQFPILFLYDEYGQCDFVRSANWDTTLRDHLEMILSDPPPWDTDKRYAKVDSLAVFNRNPGSTNYTEINTFCDIRSVLQQRSYVMPRWVAIFHVVPRGSEYFMRWKN